MRELSQGKTIWCTKVVALKIQPQVKIWSAHPDNVDVMTMNKWEIAGSRRNGSKGCYESRH